MGGAMLPGALFVLRTKIRKIFSRGSHSGQVLVGQVGGVEYLCAAG